MAESLWLKIITFILLITLASISNAEEQNNSNIIYDSSNISPTESSIVIIIDASGSVALEDPSTGLSHISLIKSNAFNIIKNIKSNISVGIVTFGESIRRTNLLPMDSEANKVELNNFISIIDTQKISERPNADLDKGLLAAEELMREKNSTKNIIVLSDGIISPEGFNVIRQTIIDLKNKEIKIQFVQILTFYETAKEPNILYNELAIAADGHAIVQNPDERMNFIETISTTSKATITPPSTVGISPTITANTSKLEQEVEDLKERLNKVEEEQNRKEVRKSWLESIIAWLKSIF